LIAYVRIMMVLMLGIDVKLTKVNGLSSYMEIKDYKRSSSSKGLYLVE